MGHVPHQTGNYICPCLAWGCWLGIASKDVSNNLKILCKRYNIFFGTSYTHIDIVIDHEKKKKWVIVTQI